MVLPTKLQTATNRIIPRLNALYTDIVSLSYIPTKCRETKVVFIAKPHGMVHKSVISSSKTVFHELVGLIAGALNMKERNDSDDLLIAIRGKFPNTLRDILQRAFNITARWARKNGLGIKPTNRNRFYLKGKTRAL